MHNHKPDNDQNHMAETKQDESPKPFEPLIHMGHAGRYSYQGLKVLFKQETSSKIELILFCIASIFFFGTGRSFTQWLILLGLFLLLLAIEALNSAIENIVDHISPDYSEFAKDTKDLGSAAVFLISAAIITYHIYVFWPVF